CDWGKLKKRPVVPIIAVVSQVLSALVVGACTPTHGRSRSVLLPQFSLPRLRPPRRRKPHRHRPPRQGSPVSPALLPLLPRPLLRAQGPPAVPRPSAGGEDHLDPRTHHRGLWRPPDGPLGQGPSRYRQPLYSRRRGSGPRRARRTGRPLAFDPRAPDGR